LIALTIASTLPKYKVTSLPTLPRPNHSDWVRWMQFFHCYLSSSLQLFHSCEVTKLAGWMSRRLL
jgi:hypothetical protein